MFRIGDKIVHPMHGAGIVDQIVTRKVNGVLRDYYSLKLPLGDMLVMIPTESCGEIGVRSILSGDETERVLGKIPDLQVEMDTNWNHRYRENMERLKSGDLLEVAKVAKGLTGSFLPWKGEEYGFAAEIVSSGRGGGFLLLSGDCGRGPGFPNGGDRQDSLSHGRGTPAAVYPHALSDLLSGG